MFLSRYRIEKSFQRSAISCQLSGNQCLTVDSFASLIAERQ